MIRLSVVRAKDHHSWVQVVCPVIKVGKQTRSTWPPQPKLSSLLFFPSLPLAGPDSPIAGEGVSKIFGVKVCNTGGTIFSSIAVEADAALVKSFLKCCGYNGP